MAFSPVLMASLRLPRPCHTHVVLQRYCEQEAHRYPDGDLMSQAKILEFSVWLVDEAVQQNSARYSFSSVGGEATPLLCLSCAHILPSPTLAWCMQ